jgi:hypothetical protein
VQLTPVNFSGLDSILLHILPILLLALFTLLDEVGTRFLRNALQLSEEARAGVNRR